MTGENSPSDTSVTRVQRTAIDSYRTGLREPSRPPSRGGNTAALHGHSIEIGGVWYSFLALGAQKWVFASDMVAFDWSWDSTGKYRNIDKQTISVWDRHGALVVRGNRGAKPKLRTAQTRLPARRSEWKD